MVVGLLGREFCMGCGKGWILGFWESRHMLAIRYVSLFTL